MNKKNQRKAKRDTSGKIIPPIPATPEEVAKAIFREADKRPKRVA